MSAFRLAVLPCLLLGIALPLASFHRPEQEPAAAPAQDEVKAAKARQIMEMTGAANLGKQVMDMMLDQFAKMPGLPAGFTDKFKQMADAKQLTDLVVPIYVKHLDLEAMDSAIEFFKSPNGSKWIAAQSKIVQESGQAGQKWGQELAMKVLQALQSGK